ncbi:endoplasmic reticulum protein-like protein [Cucurbitaria berberidis CBS 394.84]|uniref:Endoplasmic reticulum transmembrane protein n=1 Tax=Cucurbitaria berberidis CBS 394.84 TaxID=1168544 RepID=A0A9P4GRZ4_9PLEO|nr:endoplasmic reticulum protein-like protein [Cucurbitaria berberidis CBS 394.84]KAF1851458.1 endoplasmic reticulum protein-like protein [Cucurbitaria berberidis CBS 394.84]
MTLYYSLVFLLLVAEMVIFMALIVPLPFTWRRKLFTLISESPIIAKLQYGMKITFIFILILFIDSVNRVYRVQLELSSSDDSGRGGRNASLGGIERMEVQARKFYSQRNMYLCGFTLFLSLILNRTYVLIVDVLRLEEEVKTLRGDPKGKKGTSAKDIGGVGEVGALKEELAAKDRDMENLKKQVENMQKEYNRMGDQVSGKAL